MAQNKKPKPRRSRKKTQTHAPKALNRPPRTDLAVHIDQLDEQTFRSVEVVADRLLASMPDTPSIERLKLLSMKSNLLRAMVGTHRSIRRLTEFAEGEMDLSVDALPLTRMQLERCFLGLLIEDDPNRWPKRYRKNAWKAFAEKFFRDQQAVGHLDPFKEYFGSSGQGITFLREFAREMDVWEDELQTLRIQIQNDRRDPRWKTRHIADMPTPGRAMEKLQDPTRLGLARLIYPYYDSLSHFSHGGLMGIMEAAILRGEGGDHVQERTALARQINETALPLSYVSMLFVTTLFALPFVEEEDIRNTLLDSWKPYNASGSLLGITLWDNWAAENLDQTDDQG
ncbi:MAG: hypothetical protein ACLFVU_10085 [Phycisphaerae bacterium]